MNPIPGPRAKTNFLEMKSVYQFDPAGNIYYGRNKTYDIKIYSPEGKHILGDQALRCILEEMILNLFWL
jgi:hypothetical protein